MNELSRESSLFDGWVNWAIQSAETFSTQRGRGTNEAVELGLWRRIFINKSGKEKKKEKKKKERKKITEVTPATRDDWRRRRRLVQ